MAGCDSSSDAVPQIGLLLVNYRDYAARHLEGFLASLTGQVLPGPLQLCIVDNEASPQTQALLARQAPSAQLLSNPDNRGFAEACNQGIAHLRAAGCQWFLLCNMDTRLQEGAIQALYDEACANPRAAAVQGRLHLYPETELCNSTGNAMHFLGFGFCRGYRQPVVARGEPESEILYPSGALVLLRDEALCQVGGFDARLWMYCEDQDLGWRLWLAGWQCRYADAAVAEHHYAFARSRPRYYLLDRNRIICLLKNAHPLTLLGILPAFFLMECGQLYFALRRGWFRDKLRVWAWFCQPAHLRYLWRARAGVQACRRIRDRRLVGMIAGRLSYPEIDGPLLRLANLGFGAYWGLLRRLIFW